MTQPGPVEINDEHYYSSPEFFMAQAAPVRQVRSQGPEGLCGRVRGDAGMRQGQSAGGDRRGGLHDRHGTQRGRRGDGLVRPACSSTSAGGNGTPTPSNTTTSRVCGTPSYYVQKMFSRDPRRRGAGPGLRRPVDGRRPAGGAIGVGTWATQAEFKDIQVTQGDKVLFQSRTSPRACKGWRIHERPVAGQGRRTAADRPRRGRPGLAGDRKWKDYTLHAQGPQAGRRRRLPDPLQRAERARKVWWNIGGWGNRRHAIELDGVRRRRVDGHIETGRWYDIRIEVQGSPDPLLPRRPADPRHHAGNASRCSPWPAGPASAT